MTIIYLYKSTSGLSQILHSDWLSHSLSNSDRPLLSSLSVAIVSSVALGP